MSYEHLPPGRNPGSQSRRLEAGTGITRGLLPAMAVLFIACFIGIPLLAVSLTGSDVVILPILGALMLVFLVAMLRLARRFRPKGAWQFRIFAEPLELRRGEEVEAELTISDPEELGDRLEVGIVCAERYDWRGMKRAGHGSPLMDRVTGDAVAYEQWVPASSSDEEQTFRFRIPRDAPYSHEGDCLSFAWRVSARVPGSPSEDATSDDPIWVLP